MEFLRANFLNTTTQITVNSNTLSAENLFNRDPLYQWYSDGFNNDATTASIRIQFDATTSVSRLALFGINFKQFSIFYNDSTANTFALTAGDTTVSSYTGNTDADKYFRFSTTQCTSITIEAKTTMSANQEKYVSMVLPTDLILQLEKIPDAKGYKPKITPKQIVHKLSDGGTRLHNIRKKWEVTLDLDYVSTTQRDALYDDIFELEDAFNFCPFGTATGWDGICFESVWEGGFNFYEYSDNAAASGFSGKINLKETPF